MSVESFSSRLRQHFIKMLSDDYGMNGSILDLFHHNLGLYLDLLSEMELRLILTRILLKERAAGQLSQRQVEIDGANNDEL